MTTPITPITHKRIDHAVIDLVPVADESGAVVWADVAMTDGHLHAATQLKADASEPAPLSQLPTARMAAGPANGDEEEFVRVGFDPDRLAWWIRPHPRQTAGPAGVDRLVLAGDVELVVDAAEPQRFLSVTIDLPTSPDEPGIPAPHPAAFRLVAELFGAPVADAVGRSWSPAPDQMPTWSILPLSPAGAANRANVCALAAIHGLATAEPYPNPWWAADMVIPANSCTRDCGLSEHALRFAGIAAQEFADLSDADAASLDPHVRRGLDRLAPVIEHLVPTRAAEISDARERLGHPQPDRIRFTDDEVNESALDLERLLDLNFGRDLAGVLGAEPSGDGLAMQNGIVLRESDDEAALGETASFAAPAGLDHDLPERIHVRIYPIPDRPHAVYARIPLRQSVKKLASAWIRLGVVDTSGRTELVTESKCWVATSDNGFREGVAELVLPDGISLRPVAALRLELADGPTWPRARDAGQQRRDAEYRVRRGLRDEALGDPHRAALWFRDAARRYGQLKETRQEAAALRLAARAWQRAGKPDAARAAAARADQLHPDVTAPPPRAAHLGEWFGQQTDLDDED
jgi:hypothetical protein